MKLLMASAVTSDQKLLRQQAEQCRTISGILIASDFRDAVSQLAEDLPDLMIMDLELLPSPCDEALRLLRLLQPNLLFAVYAPFAGSESLEIALKAGAADFMVSPLSALQAAKTLQNLIARRQTEAGWQESEREMLRDMKVEKALFRLCAGSSTHHIDDLYADICEAKPAYQQMEECRIAVIPVHHLAIDKRMNDGVVLLNQISAMAEQVMRQHQAGRVISRMRTSGEMLLFFSAAYQEAEEICREIVNLVRDKIHITLHAGLGNTMAFPNCARASTEQARFNALTANLFDANVLVHTGDSAVNQLFSYDLQDFEEQLFAAILSGNAQSMRASVHAISKEIFVSRNFSLRQLDKLRTVYQGMRTAWVEAFRRLHPGLEFEVAAPNTGYPFDETGCFSIHLFEEMLCQDLAALSHSMLISQQQEIDQILEKIELYLRRYYMKKLSQTDIAREFGLNPSYLSRVFKQKYGLGMVEFVNRLRIEKSKEYLTQDNTPQKNIAEMLGFSDEKYFCRVFKAMEGVSPGKYRKGA